MSSNTEPIAIHFRKVTKKYQLYKNEKVRMAALLFGRKVPHKTKVANHSLDFEIRRGESVAILGRNGAGKSTMLKMITGVVFPTSGDVTVNGQVGALLELTAGFEKDFTGRENIKLKGVLLGMSPAAIKKMTRDAIEFAELGDYIDQPLRTYSSGMKARLGFAIHANANPDILVIDEALSVGDAKFQEKSRLKVREIMERDHVTVLFVTHSLESAKEFCDRGMVLKDGKVYYDGPIVKAIEKYKGSLK